MKISVKQYAQSLYEVVSAAADSEVDVIIKNFIKILKQKNDLNKADKIIKEFGVIWNKERGILEGELVAAREMGDEIIELLNSQIIKLLDAKEIQLEQRIDKDIIGGFKARIGDTIIDGSIKSQLNSLKHKLIHY